jgi:DNA anti-recombination protein RmuC
MPAQKYHAKTQQWPPQNATTENINNSKEEEILNIKFKKRMGKINELKLDTHKLVSECKKDTNKQLKVIKKNSKKQMDEIKHIILDMKEEIHNSIEE